MSAGRIKNYKHNVHTSVSLLHNQIVPKVPKSLKLVLQYSVWWRLFLADSLEIWLKCELCSKITPASISVIANNPKMKNHVLPTNKLFREFLTLTDVLKL